MVTNRSEKFLSSRDRPNVHPLHVSRCQMLYLLLARQPGLLERKIKNKAKSFFFYYILMSTLTWITEKEIALQEQQQQNFITAVRK